MKNEGITAYCLTGAYVYPSVTLTGSVDKDIVYIDEILGCKLAVSDHRCSHPTKEELIRLVSDIRMASLIAGKPGVLHIHVGGVGNKLKDIMEIVREEGIPITHFRPTHMDCHLKEAMEFMAVSYTHLDVYKRQLLNRPGLCMGNILGSDLFNLVAISVIILFYFKGFSKGRVSKSYRNVAFLVFLIYIFIALNFMDIVNVRILNLSITSVLILLVYILGAKYLAVANDVDTDEDALDYHASMSTKLSIKQIGFRFFLASVGIIAFSIMLTYLTDQISVKLNLGQGLAGALFLGIATSLPELASTITLFKMRNYNIAVGNIVGLSLIHI